MRVMLLRNAPLCSSSSAARAPLYIAVFTRHSKAQHPAQLTRFARAICNPPILCPRTWSRTRSLGKLQGQRGAIVSSSQAIWPAQRLASGSSIQRQAQSILQRGQEALQEGANLPQPSESISGSANNDLLQDGSVRDELQFHHQSTSQAVAYWLLLSAASVFGIVVLGGLTRLTESGLSITEWKPVTGALPPLSAADWAAEFAKYQASPEFRMLNSRMTLAEYKTIYWMEWAHRLWGRAIGLAVVLPGAYFLARGRVHPRDRPRLVGIAALIGVQGLLGWLMVRSGLGAEHLAPGSHPRVSHYWLAAHLGTAFLTYGVMVLTAQRILLTYRLSAGAGNIALRRALRRLTDARVAPFRRATIALAALVFCTALSGALVAGLDAGLVYNDFPFMGGGTDWLPPRAELLSDAYARRADGADGWWRNMLANPALVQLEHRVLATTTFCSVLGLNAWAALSPALRARLPCGCVRALRGTLGVACVQVALGISTLIYMVPVPLAAAHQAGALALLTAALLLAGRTSVPAHLRSLLSIKPKGANTHSLHQHKRFLTSR